VIITSVHNLTQVHAHLLFVSKRVALDTV